MADTEMIIAKDPADLAERAAALFARLVAAAAAEYRTFSVALSGGTTPRALFTLLAAPPYREQIAWPLIHFFWGDERWVPLDAEESNYHMAEETLLSRVPVPPENIHPMRTDFPSEQEAAGHAERDLIAHFGLAPGEVPRLDLILLGLGDDGHTASLFPGHSALDVTDKLVVASPPGRLPPPVDRLTVTFPVLNAGAQVVFLVAGANKAGTVRRVLHPAPGSAPLPAQQVQPVDGRLTWMLDQAAAAELSR